MARKITPGTEKKRSASRRPPAPPTAPSRDAVAVRAYELFVQRGGAHGHHEQDWLRAEGELFVAPRA